MDDNSQNESLWGQKESIGKNLVHSSKLLISACPNGKDKAVSPYSLSYELTQESWSLEQLTQHISRGKAFVPCHLRDYRKGRNQQNFLKSNLIVQDIDGSWNLDEFVSYAGHQCTAIYTSASHSDQGHRFRPLIRLPGVLENRWLYRMLLIMLRTVFRSDNTSIDFVHAYYGNSKAEWVSVDPGNTLDIDWLHREYYAALNQKKYRTEIQKLCNEGGISASKLNELFYAWAMENGCPLSPLLFNINIDKSKIRAPSSNDTISLPQKKGYHKIQRLDFKDLEEGCQLIRKFDTHQYAERIHVLRSLIQVEGGIAFAKSLLKKSGLDIKKYTRVMNDLVKKEKPPSSCEACCPIFGTGKCKDPKNLIGLQPIRRGQVRRIKRNSRKSISLQQARTDVARLLQGLVSLNDGKIHILSIQTGVGKTRALNSIQLPERCTISAPNFRVLNEINRGTKYPELPAELTKLAAPLYSLGLNAIPLLKSMVKEQESKILDQYLREREETLLHERICITNERLFCDQEAQKEGLIICDEDPISSQIKEGSVSVAFVEQIESRCRRNPPTEGIARFLSGLLDLAENELTSTICPLNKAEIKFLAGIVYELGGPTSGDLLGLISSSVVMRSSNSTLKYGQLRKFREGQNVIILSATADAEIYRMLYGEDRVVLHELPPVAVKGTLKQHTRRSFSRTSLLRPDRYEEAKQLILTGQSDGMAVISHKILGNEVSLDGYFGMTQGFNSISGRDLIVLGTPWLPEDSLRIRSALLGLPHWTIGGYREAPFAPIAFEAFEFSAKVLSSDPRIQRLQLHHTWSELMQAVGRSRYLEHAVLVLLYANFPLEEFDLVDD